MRSTSTAARVSLLAGAYGEPFHTLSIPILRATFVLSADEAERGRRSLYSACVDREVSVIG